MNRVVARRLAVVHHLLPGIHAHRTHCLLPRPPAVARHGQASPKEKTLTPGVRPDQLLSSLSL